nr:MAG TPA: hypothetical protein [Caudoviricetes sp.]
MSLSRSWNRRASAARSRANVLGLSICAASLLRRARSLSRRVPVAVA